MSALCQKRTYASQQKKLLGHLVGAAHGGGFAERTLRNIWSRWADHSALMLAARITLPHFSVSSATSFPNSAGVIGMGSPASSARRVCNFESANTAFTA